MQFILDHLAATVVGMAILVLLVALQLRGQEASVDATQYYAAKKFSLTFVSIIERDFQSMYADQASGPAITSVDSMHIQFVSADTAGVQQTIRYEKLGDPGPAQTFSVRRTVVNESSSVEMPNIAHFDVRLMDQQGNPLTGSSDVDQVFQVEVSLSVESPLGQGDFMKRSHWRSVFRPVKLSA